MHPYLFTALVAALVTLASMVAAQLLIKSHDWWRLAALVLAVGFLSLIAALRLPGSFEESKDIANGLLFFMWLIQSFWFAVASIVYLFALERPASWIVAKIRPDNSTAVEDVFE